MNQPQRKAADLFSPSMRTEDMQSSATAALADDGHADLASPARALQEKLSRELQSRPLFSERYSAWKIIGTFTAACAGTWIFGALLYLQV